MRHPTRLAIDRLNEELGLVEDPLMQDWEIECAAPSRVNEFIDFYERKTESNDERFTLMALILGSIYDFDTSKPPHDSTWKRIRRILQRDRELHQPHIEYYQCITEGDNGDDSLTFPITRAMCQIELKPEAPKN